VKSKQRWYQRHQLFNRSVPESLLPWLFDASSLTSRMIALCGDGFSVRVLSQHWQKISSQEASAMGLAKEHSALVRQVVLCCEGEAMVYARTVIPASTVQGAQRRYANLGSRPLGAMLFADRTMRREFVQVALLPDGDEARKNAAIKDIADDEAVWGRRSVFRVAGKPLLVSEYFLPEFARLQQSAKGAAMPAS